MNRTQCRHVAMVLAGLFLLAGAPGEGILSQVALATKMYMTIRPVMGASFAGPELGPLPSGFFGPGSESFAGPVDLDLIDLFRADILNLPPTLPPGDTASIDVEIIALSLRSAAPIQIDFATGPEFFDVFIDIDPNTSGGSFLIDRSTGTGGTAFAAGASFLDLFYDIQFAPTGQQPDGSLQLTNLGLAPLRVELDADSPWSSTLPGVPPGDNFFLGTDGTSADGVTMSSPGGGLQLGFLPAPNPPRSSSPAWA